jgi:hypothetical protein
MAETLNLQVMKTKPISPDTAIVITSTAAFFVENAPIVEIIMIRGPSE